MPTTTRSLATVLAALLLTLGARADEIEFSHINDHFSGNGYYDDRYTATIGIAGTVRDWHIAFEEILFTDKINTIRHDETYLTVSRELLPERTAWSLRAELGVAQVGEGLFGEDFQGLIHDVLMQERITLPYATDERTGLFVNLLASRPVIEWERFTLTPELELESAGFKRHARLTARASWKLPRNIGAYVEGGRRWTDTDYGTLVPWVDSAGPAYAMGLTFMRHFELRWSMNHFGIAGRHWHLVSRFEIGAKKKKKTPRLDGN